MRASIGTCRIHVVVDAHLGLARAQAVKAAGVLDERALPRDGHGQEEGVQPRVVEPLADVASGRQDEALLVARDGGQLRLGLPPCLGGHTALEHHEVTRKASQARGEVLEVVSPLREEDRRSSLLEGANHVVQDELVALAIGGDRGIELLDPGALVRGSPAGRQSRGRSDDASKGRRAVSLFGSMANRTGPHCMWMIGWCPSRRYGVAVRPVT